MNKDRLRVAAGIFVLAVFIVTGGFAVRNLYNTRNMTAGAVQESAADLGQENSVQASDFQGQEGTESAEAEDTNNKEKYSIIKYVVKSGDTLEAIGKAHGVKVSTIAQSNGISQNSTLKIGQELEFPSVDGLLYKIKGGDTLWDLAATYDIETNYVVAINSIESADRLKIGQEIFLPGVEKLKVQKEAPKPIKVASRSSSSGKSTSASTPVKPASGSGMWPVKGKVTSKFGSRWGTQHNGIDIAAPVGTNIYAYMSGRVIYSQWNSGGYGYLVKIDHGNGLVTYYGHNSKNMVSVGQYVSKGQHIAEVGSTGYSTGSHCHFEIRKNGTPVNPYNYLK